MDAGPASGLVVAARVEMAEPPQETGQDLLTAAARGAIEVIPVLLRRLIGVPDGLVHIVRLPVNAVLKTLRLARCGGRRWCAGTSSGRR